MRQDRDARETSMERTLQKCLTTAAAALAMSISSLVVPAVAQTAGQPKPAASQPSPPPLPDPFAERVVDMGGVRVTTDIVYAAIPGFRPLQLDLYRPVGQEPRPLVVYIHGGGWMIGHRRAPIIPNQDFTKTLADLARRGYVVAAISYRFNKEAPFPAALDDVATAIRFLRADAKKYGIDPSRVATWGGSAGAQLAVLQAVNCGRLLAGDDRSNPEQSDCVSASVGWYGPYDFRDWGAAYAPVPRNIYLDCTIGACSAERLASASAITFVDAKDPPILLVTGSNDETVPDSQSRAMAAAIKAVNGSVELEVIPDVGHGWKSVDPAKRTAAMKLATDATFSFLDRHLKAR